MLSLVGSIKEDVNMIKDDPTFGGNAPPVVGLLYEIETGRLSTVE